MVIFRRRGEQRTLTWWPTWSAQEGSPVTPDNALCVADIYACVRCLSDAAGSLPLVPYRRTDTDRQRLYSGRLHELLTRPAWQALCDAADDAEQQIVSRTVSRNTQI
jgi:hypothetical protein